MRHPDPSTPALHPQCVQEQQVPCLEIDASGTTDWYKTTVESLPRFMDTTPVKAAMAYGADVEGWSTGPYQDVEVIQ